jgi:hypothetical protein
MPTALEHRSEARRLTDTLDTLRNVRAELLHDRDDLGVRGGTTHVVRWALDAAVADVDEVGRLGTALVDELHRRAALCDQYTADLARYDDAHRQWTADVRRYRLTADTEHPTRWPGAEPRPPAGPFPGAVAG